MYEYKNLIHILIYVAIYLNEQKKAFIKNHPPKIETANFNVLIKIFI